MFIVMFVMAVRVHRVEGVNDAAGTEEQQCLEKSVRGEMEKPRHITPHANSKHHIAELANRRIREDALDVKAHNRNRCGDEGSDTTDVSDDERRGFC